LSKLLVEWKHIGFATSISEIQLRMA